MIEAIIAGLIVAAILAALKGPRKMILSWLKKMPKRKTRKERELENLVLITGALGLIDYYIQFPDNRHSARDILAIMAQIEQLVSKIKTKEFQEIKARLLEYSKKTDLLDADCSLDAMKDLLVKDGQTRNLNDELYRIVQYPEGKRLGPKDGTPF